MAETTSGKNHTLRGKRGTGRTKPKQIWFGIITPLLIIVGACFTVLLSIRNINVELEDSIRKQQLLVVDGQNNVVTLWLESFVNQGNRLINADLFRLYASEVDSLGGDLSQLLDGSNTDLAEQLPMMRNLLQEFVGYSEFVSGRIMNQKGVSYIATNSAIQPLSVLQEGYTRKVFEKGEPVFSNVRLASTGLVLDMFLPIYPPQFEDKEHKPVSVLMLTKNVSNKLATVLGAAPGGVVIKLVQQGGTRVEEIAPWLAEGVRSVAGVEISGDELPFAMRSSISGGGAVYSFGKRVPGLDWWLLSELDVVSAKESIKQKVNIVLGFGALISLVLLFLLGTLWWWLVGVESRTVAREMSDLADKVEEQKHFLDSINGTITDLICLKDEQGVIRYANRSFASAVGRQVEEMEGLDFAAVFGFDTARRVTATDEQVLMSGESMIINETIYLQSKKYHFQISKTPFRGGKRGMKGLVFVFRDLTELLEAQERSRKLVQQTIEALVRTIEYSDPYLAGHSRMMSELAIQVAKSMGLSTQEIATVEAAANLSQVGKMFVPKEILNKPGMLTDEEKQEVERHVEHTRTVLSDIEFELPVMDAIVQMNEKLDGSGYPEHLTGEAIGLPGRILAATNTFCAMVRPRSYRPAVPLSETFGVLENMAGQYDIEVVRRLREVVESAYGDKLLRSLVHVKEA